MTKRKREVFRRSESEKKEEGTGRRKTAFFVIAINRYRPVFTSNAQL
jgi:hypothetical protein